MMLVLHSHCTWTGYISYSDDNQHVLRILSPLPSTHRRRHPYAVYICKKSSTSWLKNNSRPTKQSGKCLCFLRHLRLFPHTGHHSSPLQRQCVVGICNIRKDKVGDPLVRGGSWLKSVLLLELSCFPNARERSMRPEAIVKKSLRRTNPNALSKFGRSRRYPTVELLMLCRCSRLNCNRRCC